MEQTLILLRPRYRSGTMRKITHHSFVLSAALPLIIILLSSSSLCRLAAGITCYQCNSLLNLKCLTSDDYRTLPVTRCDWEEAACYRTDTWTKWNGT